MKKTEFMEKITTDAVNAAAEFERKERIVTAYPGHVIHRVWVKDLAGAGADPTQPTAVIDVWLDMFEEVGGLMQLLNGRVEPLQLRHWVSGDEVTLQARHEAEAGDKAKYELVAPFYVVDTTPVELHFWARIGGELVEVAARVKFPTPVYGGHRRAVIFSDDGFLTWPDDGWELEDVLDGRKVLARKPGRGNTAA